jgi:hypothetical protein
LWLQQGLLRKSGKIRMHNMISYMFLQLGNWKTGCTTTVAIIVICRQLFQFSWWLCKGRSTSLIAYKNFACEQTVVDMVVVSDKLSRPQRTFFRFFSCLLAMSFCSGTAVDYSWLVWTCPPFELNNDPQHPLVSL